MSPIATPARGAPPPGGEKTPSGRFWIGKSGWPLAEATQLRRFGSWVSSICGMAAAHQSRRFGSNCLRRLLPVAAVLLLQLGQARPRRR